MKIIAPSYYNDFSCIADKCKHSCCVGWEIDIDRKTCEYYLRVKGDFGDKLNNNINFDCEQPHFILLDNGRCPFLNRDNLCDIIINLGENKLCEICSEHPRFRNFYTDRTEVGVGLCCEAAAELVLNYQNTVELITLEDDFETQTDEEQEFFSVRQEIFNIIQDRSIPVKERIIKILQDFNAFYPKYTMQEWADILLGLEQLDPCWTDCLHKLKLSGKTESVFLEIALEQLFVYFIYRHLPEALYDGRIEERISFAAIGVHIITAVAAACNMNIADAARLYSAEIEYSEENTQALLELL